MRGALGLLALASLISCAGLRTAPLRARTMPPRERWEYLETYGARESPAVRAAFLAGYACPGMSRDLALQLYGPPDLVTHEDPAVSDGVIDWRPARETWTWMEGDAAIGGLVFRDSGVVEVVGDAARPQGR